MSFIPSLESRCVRPACVCELRLAWSNWKADPSGPLQCLDLNLWDIRSKCLLRL